MRNIVFNENELIRSKSLNITGTKGVAKQNASPNTPGIAQCSVSSVSADSFHDSKTESVVPVASSCLSVRVEFSACGLIIGST